MTKKIGLLSLLCLLAQATAAAASPQPNLASADWAVNAPHSLAKDPPSSEAIWNLMNHLWGNDRIGVILGKLCSFRFVDLRNTGELSLVTVYDWGGTSDCDQLSIYDKGPTDIEEHYYSGGLASTDIKSVVKDIKDDGHFELVAPLGAASYCDEDWPSVYAWTGNGYTNVSSRYPKYYRSWLASLKKEIAKLERERVRLAQATPAPSVANGFVIANPWHSGSAPAPPPSVYPMQPEQPEALPAVSPEVEGASQLDIDCKQAQAAKIERFLGSKDAGMLDAIRWASSNNPHERTLAAQVFADIGTPEALKYVRTLSHDADTQAATPASRMVKHWGENDPYYAPTFDRKSPDN